MIIDHRYTDSTDGFHRLGICSICGIVLTPKAIRICAICESVVNLIKVKIDPRWFVYAQNLTTLSINSQNKIFYYFLQLFC
jgi:hypothetical protein